MTKINLKTKFITLTATTVMLILGVIFINISVAIKKSNFEKKVQKLESSLISVLSITGDLSEVKLQREKFLKDLSETSEKYESELAYLDNLRKLKNNAAWYGVEVTELVPNMVNTMPPFNQYLTINKESLQRYELELSLKGNFRSIGRLLVLIEDDNKKIYVKTISINRSALTDPGIVDVDIVAYSYGLKTL